MPLLYFLAILLWILHVVVAQECQLGLSTTTVTPSFTAGNSVSIALANAPTSGYCSLDLSTWNGASVAGLHQRAACANFVPTTIMRPDLPSPQDIVFGLTFAFTLRAYSDSGYTNLTCSTVGSLTPSVCRSANSALTALRLVKEPFGNIRALVDNKPVSGECAFYTTAWGGTSDSAILLSGDCSSQLIRPSAVELDADSSVRMLVFATDADHMTDQPLCGVNPVTIHPGACTASIAAVDTSPTEVGVTITGAQPGVYCAVYLSQWNDADKTSLGLGKISSDCSAVSFWSYEVGADLEFGSGVYSFEYAEFPIGQSSPSCSLNAVSFTFSQETCLYSTLMPVRPDPYTVTVTLDPLIAKPYGLCRVRLVSYAGTTMSVARVGPCTGRFDFISDGGAIDLADGNDAGFEYDFFPDGNVVGSTPVCSSSSAQNLTLAFTCPTAAVTQNEIPTGTYTVLIPFPQPVVGSCVLRVFSQYGQVDTPLSSCTSSASFTFEDLADMVAEVPSQVQGWKWKYFTPNGTLLCDASVNDFALFAIEMFSSFSVDSTGPGSITLRSDGIPAGMPNFGVLGCQFKLLSCDGRGPTILTAPLLIYPCTTDATVTFSDATDVPVGSNCRVQSLIYYDNNIGLNSAVSAVKHVVAAGIPVWDPSQILTMNLAGDDCMELSWPEPATTGGIPIDCYDIQRNDAGTGYLTVNVCVEGLSTQVCGFTEGVTFSFQVIAINRAGRSVDETLVSRTSQIEFEFADPDTDYISPSFDSTRFPAAHFPDLVVEESKPDALTTGRLYVGRLMSRCKLDDESATITVPLTLGDDNYTAVALPIPRNSPPAFTTVFRPVAGSPGTYRLESIGSFPAGEYSLAVYSLESGGLLGQYWGSPDFTGSPALTRKDQQVNFAWGNAPIVQSYTDLVSARWTGFIEAQYSEDYTMVVDTTDNVRVWIDDVRVIDAWTNPCIGECFGVISLQQSVPIARKFHYVRIDYSHSKGIRMVRPAGISFSWASFSQPRELVPGIRLFKAPVIQGAVRTVTLLAGDLDASSCTVTIPSGSVVAGTTGAILITARDSVGNVIRGSTDSFVATFSSQSSSNTDFPSQPVDSSKSDGLYVIPFMLTTATDYTVTITVFGSGSPLSGGRVNIVAGDVDSITSFAGTTGVAGEPFYIPVTLADSFDNPIHGGGDGSTPIPPLFVSLTWTSDAVSESRLPSDDVNARTARYGTTVHSTSVTWHSGTSKFRIALTVVCAGTYSGQVGILDGPAPISLATITITAAPLSAGNTAVVTTTPFPPTNLVAGAPSSFSLQLRDQYMNAIASALSTDAPIVVMRITSQLGETEGDCALSETTDGVVDCSIIPTSAGMGFVLSVLVDGLHASYLTGVGGGVMQRHQGPWAVNVSAGVASGADSLLVGIRAVYMAGFPADATLVLRDSDLNVLGPLEAYPLIEAYFMNGAAELPIDPTTFVYNTDGSITIPILVTVVASPLSLFVTVDGIPVPMPYGIDGTAIVSTIGVVMGAHSECDLWSDFEAGADEAITCVPMDGGDNPIGEDGLYVFSNFSFASDPSVFPIVLTGTFGSSQYSVATGGAVTRSGSYSVYSTVCQPGGLIAQYFGDADFTDLLAFDSNPLSDTRHPGVNTLYYSRIDAFIDFGSLAEFGGLSPVSVRWSGFLMPPATATYTISFAASGGARLLVGTGTAQIDLLTAESVDESFDIALTANGPIEVVLEYVVGVKPSIVLKWVYDGSAPSTPFVVPPVSLLAPLTAGQVRGYVVEVSVAPVSTNSIATFPGSYVAGVPDHIIIQAVDEFNNAYTADPTACVGSVTGSVPVCLFQASLVIDDGTTFGVAVALGDGTIKIPVTFAANGVVEIKIQLQTSSGIYSDIAGSPYSVTVSHA